MDEAALEHRLERTVNELVCCAQSGEPRAFAELIGRFERTALAIAFAATGDAQLAGDIVQEAFVKAWQRLHSLKDPDRFGPWLVGIVRNQAASHRRSADRHPATPLHDAARNVTSSADPAAEAYQRELRQRINAAISELDEVSRTAVVLRYYENLSSRQIGQLLEMSPAAVDMRLMRARAELRQRLRPFEGDPTPGPLRETRVGQRERV